MKKFKTINKPEQVVTDIKCDKCGNSCLSPKDKNADYGINHMTLKASWGYMSNHDMETWEAQICEDCAVELSKSIRFDKTDSFTGGKR
jgi:hypothetical protein